MLKKFKKTTIIKFFYIFIVLIILLQTLPLFNASSQTNCLSNTNPSDKNVLEACKYIEEIRKLQLENDRPIAITLMPILAPLVTLLIAFFGWIWSIQKDKNIQSKEKAAQRQKDTEDEKRQFAEKEAQRQKDTKDKERQFEEKYNDIVTKLGSDSLSIQASNASALLNFLQPDHEKLLDDILIIVPVNLKKSICTQPAIQESLTRVLEKAIRVKLNSIQTGKVSEHLIKTLNISRTTLFRLNLEGLDFRFIEVDVAFANMRFANLNNTQLPKLRGIGVCLNNSRISRCNLQEARLNKSRCRKALFHDSILISATFKEADLRGAEFQKARLQSVHFNGAKLQGANFTQANLADTYFYDAKLDDFAMNSILKSYKSSWRRAHFDKDIKSQLDYLSDKSKKLIQNLSSTEPIYSDLELTDYT